MDPSAGVNSSVGEFGWTGMLGTYVSIDPAEKLTLVYMHNLFPNREAYIHPRIRNIAVSYTHLDVYKRQLYRRAGRGRNPSADLYGSASDLDGNGGFA